MGAKTIILSAIFLTAAVACAKDPDRIYTQQAGEDSGVITAKVGGAVLTHAIAVERDRARVYLAALDPGGTGFRFEKLPVGRFDLVLVTRDKRVIEGLGLGPAANLPEGRMKTLEADISRADSFFNRHVIHRIGIEGESACVLVERIRDGLILRGSGELLDANLRRLEIIELREASDEWQMVSTRHLYREEASQARGIPFFMHQQIPALGGLRVAGAPRDLGTIELTLHR